MKISAFILFTFLMTLPLSASPYPNYIDDDSACTEDDYENDYEDIDILSGRGGLTNKHPGNKEFRKVVNEHKIAYRKLTKKADKAAMVRQILAIFSEKGSRFLKKNNEDGLWEELDDAEAYAKTSQALREN